MLSTNLENIHMLRVAYENWNDPERFGRLCALLKKYPCGIGSVALFTASKHSPLTHGEYLRRAAIIRERLNELRAQGFSAGINVLATIGHHEEDLDNSYCGNHYHMTGEDGRECRGSYCMNDKSYLEQYVKPLYESMTEAGPDFIWIDDDIRYGHMPVGYGCFCDGCIQKFNIQNGTHHTRKSLVEALNSGDLSVRRAWLNHNSEAITNILSFIGKVVRSADDTIALGFMTGERYVEGYDFTSFANALSDNGRYKIMWRPGGLAYTDYSFGDIVEKNEEIGRQNAYLPSCVCVNQSEIENFPYQLLKKTPVSTALEAAWNMTAGCTGAAFNILPSDSGEPIENIEPHLEEINRQMPLYRILREKTAGRNPVGICTAWRPDSQMSVPKGSFNSFSGVMYADFARELFDLGLPQCYNLKDAAVTLASGCFGLHWTDSEIKNLLSGGVYMDTSALEFVNSRGFGKMTGFEKGKEIAEDVVECYSEHHLNSGFEGNVRNAHQAFYPGDVFSLFPSEDRVENLGSLIGYHNNILAEMCHGLFKNSEGGRISAGGYFPFKWISTADKAAQLKRLMVYLSKSKLPSYVDSYCRIRNHTFVDGDNCTIALLNPTNQPLINIRIAVKTQNERFVWYDETGTAHIGFTEYDENETGYLFMTLEQLPAYEMRIISI